MAKIWSIISRMMMPLRTICLLTAAHIWLCMMDKAMLWSEDSLLSLLRQARGSRALFEQLDRRIGLVGMSEQILFSGLVDEGDGDAGHARLTSRLNQSFPLERGSWEVTRHECAVAGADGTWKSWGA